MFAGPAGFVFAFQVAATEDDVPVPVKVACVAQCDGASVTESLSRHGAPNVPYVCSCSHAVTSFCLMRGMGVLQVTPGGSGNV